MSKTLTTPSIRKVFWYVFTVNVVLLVGVFIFAYVAIVADEPMLVFSCALLGAVCMGALVATLLELFMAYLLMKYPD